MTHDTDIITALRADLRSLERDHAISPALITTLLGGKPKDVEGHISLFKFMTFIVNGFFMTLGVAAIAWGGKAPNVGGMILGGVILFWFSLAFTRNIRALKAVQAVADKYDLMPED